jgi:transposase
MKSTRTRHSAERKAEVALAAISKLNTIADIASQNKIHPTQVTKWKNQLVQSAPTVFSTARDTRVTELEALTEKLYRQIGHLTVQVDWLKKKSGLSR